MQDGVEIGAAQNGANFMLDIFGLAFLDHRDGFAASGKGRDLFGHQRIDDIQRQDGNVGAAIGIGETDLLQSTDEAIIEPALHNQTDVVVGAVKNFIELVIANELARRRHAHLEFQLLVLVGDGRMSQPIVEKFRRHLLQFTSGDFRRDIIACREGTAHMAGANAQFHDHRRIGGLRQLEAFFDHAHDGRQIGPGIHQPHSRLHGEGMGALLNDAGAFAIVFANDDQRPAHDAGRRQVGQRIGGHIGADDGFPCHGAAHRIHDRGAQHGGGGRLIGAGLNVDAKFAHQILCFDHDIEQMRDGRALIAADIGDARLQQRLGDSEDTLAMKSFSLPQFQQLDFLAE